MSTAAPTPDELIDTPDEFRAALALLKSRKVTKTALAGELGRSEVALWKWAHRQGPPRYCALHLKTAYGITKATLAPEPRAA